MSVTIVSTPYDVKSGAISIKPYFDPDAENLGLQNYGMSLHDGVFHDEQLACIERNGIKRYITGLNEFAPEVKLIKDDDVRNAKIKEIRTVVSQLERELAANIVNPEDTEFWNKVKLLRPDNDEFWDKVSLRCGNQKVPLDPAKDPYDIIKIYAIEAGGFSMVAPSFEAARSMAQSPKFYLDKYVDTASTQTEGKKVKNKALSELDKLYNKNQNKLFYVAKVLDANSTQYRKNTPNDIIYDNMDKYINGQSGFEKNIMRAATAFIETADLDMETLKIKAMIKDATTYRYIAFKADGFIYDVESTTQLGRNPHECVDYLKNPLNEKILVSLTKRIEKMWNQ